MAQGFWESTTEPKRNFRYKVSIGGLAAVSSTGATAQAWYAKKATKPSFTVGEVKANFIDKTFYYPGRVEWNTVEVVFYDPVNPNAVKNIFQCRKKNRPVIRRDKIQEALHNCCTMHGSMA